MTYALGEERDTLLRGSFSQFPEQLSSGNIGWANPVGGAYAGRWLAAFEPVLVEGRPEALRDTGGHWFALTTRARVVYASKDRVAEDAVTTYEDLADPKDKLHLFESIGFASSLLLADNFDEAINVHATPSIRFSAGRLVGRRGGFRLGHDVALVRTRVSGLGRLRHVHPGHIHGRHVHAHVGHGPNGAAASRRAARSPANRSSWALEWSSPNHQNQSLPSAM